MSGPRIPDDHGESRPFRVDLGGVIGLLSRHLYSTPAVYLRELVQNAVDAGAARHREFDDAPATEIRVTPRDDGTITVSDNGIGLSAADAADLLATVGRSSKSDSEHAPPETEFLGAFGIGLLSCFLVADTIVVRSRSARGSAPIEWTGSIDGTFVITELDDPEIPVGTTVLVRPRAEHRSLTTHRGVTQTLTRYAQYLPATVTVTEADGSRTRINRAPVFARDDASDAELTAFARDLIGRPPIDVVRLTIPGTGSRGIAIILPTAPPPGSRPTTSVYLRGMLLNEHVEDLAPDWGFFAHIVLDSTDLTPTASREQLITDTALEFTRDQITDSLRNWILLQAKTKPHILREFVTVHSLGLKALSVHDDELAALILPVMTVETSLGEMSIQQVVNHGTTVRYAASVDEFRQLAPVSQNAGPLVNAGYVFDAELMERLPLVNSGIVVERATVGSVVDAFDVAPLDDRARTVALEERADDALAETGCRVSVRQFQPDDIPALYVSDPAVIRRINRGRTSSVAPGPWSSVIGRLDALVDGETPTGDEATARLCLNWSAPLVRRLAQLTDEVVFTRSIRLLYLQSLISSHRPLSRGDRGMLNDTIGDLIQLSVGADDIDLGRDFARLTDGLDGANDPSARPREERPTPRHEHRDAPAAVQRNDDSTAGRDDSGEPGGETL